MNFIGADTDYNDAAAVIFGAPYDSTTSFRPGGRFGPAAMRMDSFGIETYSPYQDRDLEDIRVHDAGDIELPFGAPEPVLEMIEAKAAAILDDGKVIVNDGAMYGKAGDGFIRINIATQRSVVEEATRRIINAMK